MSGESSRKFGKGDWIMLLSIPIITGIAILASHAYLDHQPARAAAYADYAALLHASEVQKMLHDPSLSPEEADLRAMQLIEGALSQFDSPYSSERKRHPISMQTLRAIEPRLNELQASGENLERYILQDGQIVPDGSSD